MGLYHYGRLRRTDWLPVGEPRPHEQLTRGDASLSSGSDSESDDDYDRDEQNPFIDHVDYDFGDDSEEQDLDEGYDSEGTDDYPEGEDPGPELSPLGRKKARLRRPPTTGGLFGGHFRRPSRPRAAS